MRLRLSCDGKWVNCSSDLALLHSGRVFVIEVDPTALTPGLHYTSIEGDYVTMLLVNLYERVKCFARNFNVMYEILMICRKGVCYCIKVFLFLICATVVFV